MQQILVPFSQCSSLFGYIHYFSYMDYLIYPESQNTETYQEVFVPIQSQSWQLFDFMSFEEIILIPSLNERNSDSVEFIVDGLESFQN